MEDGRGRETESNSSDVSQISSDKSNKDDVSEKKTSLRIINTNARSVGPKKQSLVDCLEEQEIDLAIVTETWLQTGDRLEQELRDLADLHAINVLVRNRSGRAGNGRQYGGLAIATKAARSKYKKLEVHNPRDFEVLVAAGTIAKIKGKVICIACYMPPNMRSSDANDNLEYLVDLVTEMKRMHADCTIVVGGDFNQWDASMLAEEHPDLTEVIQEPTRGDRELDRTFVNFARAIHESGTFDPLQDDGVGSESDHKIAYLFATFETPKSKLVSYTYRYYSHAGAQGFITWMGGGRQEPGVCCRNQLRQGTCLAGDSLGGNGCFLSF